MEQGTYYSLTESKNSIQGVAVKLSLIEVTVVGHIQERRIFKVKQVDFIYANATKVFTYATKCLSEWSPTIVLSNIDKDGTSVEEGSAMDVNVYSKYKPFTILWCLVEQCYLQYKALRLTTDNLILNIQKHANDIQH